MSPRVTVESANETAYVDYLVSLRTSRTYSTYVPGLTPDSAGLADASVPLKDIEVGSNGYVNLDAREYENCRFWGTAGPKFDGVATYNCHFTGGDPATGTSGGPAVQNYGSAPNMIEMTDCLLDPHAWHTVRGRTTWRRSQFGIHGGMFRAERCEIRNVEDGVNHVGRSSGDPWTNLTEMLGCWVHGAHYVNMVSAPSDGQTHNDPFQFNTGKNIRLIGNLFGGPRDMVGYRTWPGGWNSGDDFWNAGIMIKQEVSSTAPQSTIENVEIRGNFFWGGTASINHASSTGDPQTFASMVVADNYIVERGSDWGRNKKTDASGAVIENTANGGPGYEILKHNNVAATYSNNRRVRVNPDGTFVILGPATISRG